MKDAITYAHEAGFFEFNVIGWKAEFERLIESVRADALAELATVKDSLTVQSSDHIADAGKVMLTTEQAQQIEEASARVEQSAEECMGDDGMVMVAPLDLYNELVESLEAIRAARAQEQAEQEPVAAIKECLTAANTKIPAFLRRAGNFGD